MLDSRNGEEYLYNIAQDPQQQRNLCGEEPARRVQLKEVLRTHPDRFSRDSGFGWGDVEGIADPLIAAGKL